MGTSRPERQTPLARTAYIAALRRFAHAHTALLLHGVPLDPGTRIREWTRADVAVLRELHESLGQVLETRRAWDRLRHDRSPQH
ncbi:hypothetical protein [Actinoplanes sp. GCM10030250]|uniref:hypothetical protein n=1 Tax=Actinoplanes sp. GCM10030250 TaxID=3273376 RepID=UPI00361B73C6